MPYADVHAHLTHEDFKTDLWDVVARAEKAGLAAIIVNGLEPTSNRQILAYAQQNPVLKPALGIYPVEAVNGIVKDLPFPVARFNVDDEIRFIAEQAAAGRLFAIGECGLDGHWIKDDTFAEQERVFEELIAIAMRHDLPLIIHTRKREKRAMEILAHHGAKKVDFHCFGGKSRDAIEGASKHGWWFSIPANARVNESFTKMLRELPEEKILTETDCPYLAPHRGTRNEPANVVGTVGYLASLRGWTEAEAQEKVWRNFLNLFGARMP